MPRLITTALLLTLATTIARAEEPAAKVAYDKMCASCHGADGHGNAAKAATLKVEPRLFDLGRDEAKGISRDEKRKIVVDGKGKMPAYAKKLAPAQVDPVLDHALGLVGSAPAAAAPDSAPASGPASAPAATPAPAPAPGTVKVALALWKKHCASCHGADGAGKASAARKLKIEAELLDLGRDATKSLLRDDAMGIVRDGKDKMPAFAKKLKPLQIAVVTDHAVALAAARRGAQPPASGN